MSKFCFHKSVQKVMSSQSSPSAILLLREMSSKNSASQLGSYNSALKGMSPRNSASATLLWGEYLLGSSTILKSLSCSENMHTLVSVFWCSLCFQRIRTYYINHILAQQLLVGFQGRFITPGRLQSKTLLTIDERR